MSARAAERAARLRRELDTRWPQWGVAELELVGSGLDAAVFRAESRAFGAVAVRVPWTRWISNDNDPSLDARALLAVEELLANHMLSHGVSAPRAFALHRGDDDFDFLVSAYVPDDGSAEDPAAFGAMVRRIHEAPVTVEIERSLGTANLADTLPERIIQRLDVARRLSGVSLPVVSIALLRDIVTRATYRPTVLHMDARRANLRVVRGDIGAILDWSNALLGDPALELARIAESSARDSAFDAGYGARSSIPRELDLVYRLDTAVMLSVVFLSEAPDPALATRQVDRVHELLSELHSAPRSA